MGLAQTVLGRTGLTVSCAGLGGGGHSRLGTRTGGDFDHAVAVVRRALDLGVNLIDTATSYGTEPHVAAAIAQVPRERVVISSKSGVRTQEGLLSGAQFEQRVEASLERLNTSYIDIYHLHGLSLGDYDHATCEIVPALQRCKNRGLVRFLAVSEAFDPDPSHQMLQRALDDDWCDVVMVGFNMLNPSARRTVLPRTMEKRIGTLGMFAVRRALTRPERLVELLGELVEDGRISREVLQQLNINDREPLRFLGDARAVVEAGYRYCLHEPGIDVVLFGTGNLDHFEANIRSLSQPPLDQRALDTLDRLFGGIDSISGN